MNTAYNDGNGTGSHGAESASSSRYPTGEQCGPGHHPATAKTGLTKEMSITVIECYCLSNPVDEKYQSIRGCRRQCIVLGMSNKICM